MIYALIGKLLIGGLVVQTLGAWIFHFMNKSDMPEDVKEWLLWSCLPWVMINFRRDDEEEGE